ncbi:hypothetical protein [Phenylobacterium sp.]|jgi:hypothetical protein|uniref:hypothetical protein n=1 Tax=Phenylobacterium sp. TaxID=1871053 RepID=UPI002F94E1CF
MRALLNISCAAAFGLLATGCVTHSTAQSDAATALGGSSSAAASVATSGAGMASASEGDHWTAANLFEQAVVGNNSPRNRFNLATEYQNTGRLDQAAALYGTVIADGQYTQAATNTSREDRNARSVGVNLADESQRRLTEMQSKALAGAAPSAADFAHGASASASVGGPTSGQVTDARALRLDRAADDAAGE